MPVRLWVYYVQLGVPLVAAEWAQLIYDGDVKVHENFYVSVAAIIPVLLLALMVELASAVSLQVHNARMAEAAQELQGIAAVLAKSEGRLTTGPTPLEQLAPLREVQARYKQVNDEHEGARELLRSMSVRLRRLVRCFFIQAAAGEAAALYALAAQRTAAFLVALCTAVLIMLTWNLWRTFELRFEKPRDAATADAATAAAPVS